MKDHIERMKVEFNDLKQKIDGLSTFIYSNEIYQKLDNDERVRMAQQLAFMQSYRDVLLARLTTATCSN